MTLPTTPLTDAEIYAKHTAREVVARWMTTNGFATGHGDTLYDLLYELEHQVIGLQADLQRTREALHDFLDNPLFQVAVGGNPIRVEAMIANARALLTPPTGESK